MKNEKKEIVKQYIESILNTGNSDDLSTFISPQYTEVVKNKKYRLGINGMQKKLSGIRERYPDLKLSIDLQITEGDWVITSYIMNGTQLGRLMGMSPSGKNVEVRGVNIDKVVNNRITEHESTLDILDPLIEHHQHSMQWVKENLENKINTEKESEKEVFEIEAA